MQIANAFALINIPFERVKNADATFDMISFYAFLFCFRSWSYTVNFKRSVINDIRSIVNYVLILKVWAKDGDTQNKILWLFKGWATLEKGSFCGPSNL